MQTIPDFDEADIQNKVPMDVAIGLMREAFAQLTEQTAVVPLRTTIETGKKEGVALFMPSYSPSWKLFGLKMVSVFPENKKDLPIVQGKMLVMSAEDGKPLALLDAASLTALRTGAASGLATDLLAHHEASTLAVFGTGTQAWTQAEGVMAVRKIRTTLVRGTSREKEKIFCQRLAEKFEVHAEPLHDLQDLKKADIICTATTSCDPLFTLAMIKRGVHINGVGSFKPEMREIGSDVMQACLLVVDQRAAALTEAGDILIPIKEKRFDQGHIHAELGELVIQKKVGRTSADQITVFKSVGNALQDLAVANYLVGNTP